MADNGPLPKIVILREHFEFWMLSKKVNHLYSIGPDIGLRARFFDQSFPRRPESSPLTGKAWIPSSAGVTDDCEIFQN